MLYTVDTDKFNNIVESYLIDENNWESFHCSMCGRFLASICIVIGSVTIKCKNCKQINRFTVNELFLLPSIEK